MCGRFVSLLSPELLKIIRELFGLPEHNALEPRFNIAPTQTVWTIRNDSGHNRLDLMKWGLIPFWAKDQKIGNSLINARSETVAEKPAFRHAIKTHRCIIPVSGFYEWDRKGEQKQPYYIHMADNSPMYFAGIWDQWKLPSEDSFLESFSILTTAANDLVADIHDRMPVILRTEDCSFWLDSSIHDPAQLKNLYNPFPSQCLNAYKVSNKVNSPRFTDSSCITRID
jgi:putative SOS response-associated peptidase YedK